MTSRTKVLSDRREKNREYQRKRRLDPEYRERQRLYFAERRKDPKVRENHKKYMAKLREDPAYLKAQQEYHRKYWRKKHTPALHKSIDNLFQKGVNLVLE